MYPGGLQGPVILACGKLSTADDLAVQAVSLYATWLLT